MQAYRGAHCCEEKIIKLPVYGYLRPYAYRTEVEWDSATENRKRDIPLTQVQQCATMTLITSDMILTIIAQAMAESSHGINCMSSVFRVKTLSMRM
jgi:hypothetical protein